MDTTMDTTLDILSLGFTLNNTNPLTNQLSHIPPSIQQSPRSPRKLNVGSTNVGHSNFPMSLRTHIPHRKQHTVVSPTALSIAASSNMYDPEARRLVDRQARCRQHNIPIPNYTRIVTNNTQDNHTLNNTLCKTGTFESNTTPTKPTSPRRPTRSDSPRRGVGTSTRRGQFGRSEMFELSTSPGLKRTNTNRNTRHSYKLDDTYSTFRHHASQPTAFDTDESFLSSLEQDGASIIQLNLSSLSWLSTYALSFIGHCIHLKFLDVSFSRGAHS